MSAIKEIDAILARMTSDLRTVLNRIDARRPLASQWSNVKIYENIKKQIKNLEKIKKIAILAETDINEIGDKMNYETTLQQNLRHNERD